MDGGVDRTQLNDFRPGGGDKAPIRRSPRGEQSRLLAVDCRHGGDGGVQQSTGVGEEGLAGEGPRELVVEAVSVQQRLDPLADIRVGEFGAEAEVELDVQLSRNDVGGAGAGLDVGDLEAGGGEVGVALIPHGGGKFRQRRRCLVDRVVRQMGVGHVALHPAH